MLAREIVSAASEVVDDEGPDAVTLRGLARRIGISAPSIYAHFPNLDMILLAVAAEAFAELSSALVTAIDAAREAAAAGGVPYSPAYELRSACHAYLNFALDRPGRYRIMFDGKWDAAPAIMRGTVRLEDVQQLGHDTLEVFVRAVQACAETRVLTTTQPTDPATAAVIIWLGLHGLAHQRLVAPAFPWPDHITDHLIDRITGLEPDS